MAVAWSLAAGVALALSYPGYGLGALVWVGLIPLCAALRGAGWRQRFWRGWLAGCAFYALILPWLWALSDWAGAFIVLGYVALCAALALLWAAWAALGGGSLVGRLPQAVAGPALWVVLEHLKSGGTFGFAWGNLGHGLGDSPKLLQLAAWTGEWGLSLLVVGVNVWLYRAWTRRSLASGAALGACLLLLSGWGTLQQSAQRHAIAEAPALRLALVQPAIDQREKSDPAQLEHLRDRYVELQAQLSESLDWIAMPESILPTLLLEDPDTLSAVQAAARSRDAGLILGSFTQRDAKLFNSVLAFDATGRFAGQYDKVRLVPFSTEYFPGIEFLRRVGLAHLLAGLPLGALNRGSGFLPLTAEGVRFGTPICFETSFADVARAFVRGGADVLLAVTNDAWFKDGLELEQHFRMGVIRSVETGRTFIQVANTGTSGVALPSGDVSLQMPVGRPGVAEVEVPLLTSETFYLRWGDWVVWLAWGGLAAAAVRRQSSHPSVKPHRQTLWLPTTKANGRWQYGQTSGSWRSSTCKTGRFRRIIRLGGRIASSKDGFICAHRLAEWLFIA